MARSRWLPSLSTCVEKQRRLAPEAAQFAGYAHYAKSAHASEVRTTDFDVVRARSVWVQALEMLFSEVGLKAASQHPPVKILNLLDRQLNNKAAE